MQIIYKVKENRIEEAKDIAVKAIEMMFPESVARKARVNQVFPGLSAGQRARLYSISLPAQLSNDKIGELVERLREEDGVEYAELPAAKAPMRDETSR